MLYGFVGRVSQANNLKEALDVGSQRTRTIADRVAKASMQNGDGFALAATTAESAQGAQPGPPVDLEAEMVSLADEQIRFEATARLLQRAYQSLRTSIRDR